MKKAFLILGCTLAIAACSDQNAVSNIDPQVTDGVSSASSSVSSDASITANSGVSCSEAEVTQFDLPEAGFTVTFPCGFGLIADDHKFSGRHGSYVYYSFSRKDYSAVDISPFFHELHFLTEDSVPEVKPVCPGLCVDTRTKAEYRKLKSEWEVGKSDRQVLTLGGTKYMVNTESWPGEDAYLREYTTFIGDTEIDIWIVSENGRQDAKSDALIEKIQFMKSAE